MGSTGSSNRIGFPLKQITKIQFHHYYVKITLLGQTAGRFDGSFGVPGMNYGKEEFLNYNPEAITPLPCKAF